jgi:hypothetical protein
LCTELSIILLLQTWNGEAGFLPLHPEWWRGTASHLLVSASKSYGRESTRKRAVNDTTAGNIMVLNWFCVLLIATVTLRGSYFYSHCTDEETGSQKG